MAFIFHIAPAKGNSVSGNISSVYEVSLEMDDNGLPYLLIALQNDGRPTGTWTANEYTELKEQLKLDLDNIPIKWTSKHYPEPQSEDGGFREVPK